MTLDSPVNRLKGVGPEMEIKLGRLGIETVGDLLTHFPRRHEDFSQVLPIRSMKPGPVTFRCQIIRTSTRRAKTRRLTITEAILADDTGTIKAVWFNQPYMEASLPKDVPVMVSGKLEFKNNDLALQAPVVELADKLETKDTARIVPIYPETEGLTSRQLRSLVLPLLPLVKDVPENLPAQVVKNNQLMPRGLSIAEMHFPSNAQALEKARYRLAFEELFFLMLTSQIIRREIKTESAPKIKFEPEAAKQFIGSIGFELTDGQRAAAWQILQDLEKEQPMNRLLEGDVGSGKTVVATMAAVMAIANGYQAALMVPTEILARQHAANVLPLLAKLGHQGTLLVSKQPAAERRTAAERISSGQAGLVIGTQALLSGDLEFNNLGLVIIDEQHRFGVNQRQQLKDKAGRLPHLLSMTATPIPRSLALTVYGDLDISVIKGLPPGRQPVTTQVYEPKDRDKAYQQIDQEIEAGRQVFVVYPLIEESEKLAAKSAVAEAQRLEKTVFKHRRIGLVHGRLKAGEKESAMERFRAGELDILVATSVIEVGVDVPNATVMLIEGAERFGLAALHQLRGRVGRGGQVAYCFVIPEITTQDITRRLQALERTSDGFRLAQIDLELRGPGQIYGQRQHGDLDLQFADITDIKLLAAVSNSVSSFLQDASNLLKYPQITERVNRLKTVTSLD